jgi:hypothetical protein
MISITLLLGTLGYTSQKNAMNLIYIPSIGASSGEYKFVLLSCHNIYGSHTLVFHEKLEYPRLSLDNP